MPRLIIISHHPITSTGSLMSPLQSGWLSPRADMADPESPWTIEFLFTGDRGIVSAFWKLATDRRKPTVLLFAELNSTAPWRSILILAINAIRLKAPQVLYWHSTAANIRSFAGLQGGGRLSRFIRRLRARGVWHFLGNARTYHWAASRMVKQAIMVHTGTVPERINVVYEALDIKKYTPSDRAARRGKRPFRVCGVGDPVYRKGVDLFIFAASRLHEQWPGEYEFVWYGASEADIRRWNMRWVGMDCLAAPMIWGGWTDDLGAHLHKGDALFLSSRDDPFPLAALEALACDIPVFSLDTTGTTEILPPGFVARNLEESMEQMISYRKHSDQYAPGFFRALAEPFDAAPFRKMSERHLMKVVTRYSSRGAAQGL